jgi:hypothetical protein
MRVLTSVRGFSANIVANIIQYNDNQFKITEYIIRHSINTSTAFDAVQFFCDIVLRVVALNSSLQTQFVQVLSAHIGSLQSLLSSSPSPTTSAQSPSPSSKAQIHACLVLVDGLLRRNIAGVPELIKPVILACLNIFFQVKLGNVIHFNVVAIFNTCFEIPCKDLVDTLVNEGKIVEKILQSLTSTTRDPTVGFHGHLMMVAKAMNACPLLEDLLRSNEAWQKMTDTVVKEFQNKSICPPDAGMLAAKQRQIQKAGGSFLG